MDDIRIVAPNVKFVFDLIVSPSVTTPYYVIMLGLGEAMMVSTVTFFTSVVVELIASIGPNVSKHFFGYTVLLHCYHMMIICTHKTASD